MTEPTTFTYAAPYNRTGYGTAAVGYGKGLIALGSNFAYSVIGNPDLDAPDLKSEISLLERMPLARDTSLPSLIFWHAHDLKSYAGGGPNIGFTTFEADDFRPDEKENLLKMDAIGTASSWGEQVLKNRLPSFAGEIFHAPHAYKVTDTDEVPKLKGVDPLPQWRKLLGQKLDEKTLVVSSAGKFEKRKGHMAILDAVQESVEPILVIAFWHNPFITDGFHFSEFYLRGYEPVLTPTRLKLFRKNKALVALMPPSPTRGELHAALGTAHAFISPSFAEGWDLPLFEMMSFGMPCIATLTTAHGDYANEDNVVPITETKLARAEDGYFFRGVGRWHEVAPQNILEALDKVRHHIFGRGSENSLQKLRELAIQKTGEITWQKSARQMLNVLSRVTKKTLVH